MVNVVKNPVAIHPGGRQSFHPCQAVYLSHDTNIQDDHRQESGKSFGLGTIKPASGSYAGSGRRQYHLFQHRDLSIQTSEDRFCSHCLGADSPNCQSMSSGSQGSRYCQSLSQYFNPFHALGDDQRPHRETRKRASRERLSNEMSTMSPSFLAYPTAPTKNSLDQTSKTLVREVQD